MALGVFTGCQDSATVAPTDSQSATTTVSSDTFDKMLIATDAFPVELDGLISDAASVNIPSFSQGPDHDGRPDDHPHGDSARGDSARGDSARGDRPGPPHDGRPMPPLPGDKYGRILAQLGLDSAQRAAIHGCYDAYRECAKDPTDQFHTALMDLRTTLNAAISDLRAQVQAGEITRDSARTQYRALIGDVRTQVAALQTTLNDALSSCQSDLVDCIKSNLTADQLAKWDELILKLDDHPGRPDRKG